MSAGATNIMAAPPTTTPAGIGVQIPSAGDKRKGRRPRQLPAYEEPSAAEGDVLIVPITLLYNRQRNFRPSLLIEPRILTPTVTLSAADAARLGIISNDLVEIRAGDLTWRLRATVTDEISAGIAALPRHLTDAPVPLTLTAGSIRRVAEAIALGD